MVKRRCSRSSASGPELKSMPTSLNSGEALAVTLAPENSSSGKGSHPVKWWSSLHNLFQFGWQFSA